MPYVPLHVLVLKVAMLVIVNEDTCSIKGFTHFIPIPSPSGQVAQQLHFPPF